MIIAANCYEEMINSPVRSIKGRVELLEGSTLLDTFTYDGALQSFTVDRIGETSKFFGYGICQKLVVKLRDNERKINILKGQRLEVVVGVGCEYLYTCPVFFVEEVNRDENTNELTITAYDAIYRASKYHVSDLDLPQSYTIEQFVVIAAALLGMPISIANNELFYLYYEQGANFGGDETIREALDAVAEATGTIYYMNNKWELVFKQLDKEGPAALTIDKSKYFTLTSKSKYTLQSIVSATELGDNISASTGIPGATQFVRNNPFFELRDDIDVVLEDVLANVSGISINQFNCKWRGNFLLEIGDKIDLITKDNQIISAYLLNDVFTYNGGLSETTKWEFIDNEGETSSTPTTLGAAIKETYARVDKANKTITLLASETSANSEAISSLQVSTDGINATVSNLDKKIEDQVEGVNGTIGELRKEVELAMSAEDVSIQIRNELSNGIEKVTTTTGYVFGEEGLTISKSGSEMETQITEDGMTVSRNDLVVLTANNVGVNAANLHATTYLIIGSYSRFEDYDLDGEPRTGCFWIGG